MHLAQSDASDTSNISTINNVLLIGILCAFIGVTVTVGLLFYREQPKNKPDNRLINTIAVILNYSLVLQEGAAIDRYVSFVGVTGHIIWGLISILILQVHRLTRAPLLPFTLSTCR